MAIGYNVIQPNGIVKEIRVKSAEERDSVVCDQLNRWGEYCDRNWISVNYSDPFCSENKVKRFLNSLAYFLMLGNTGGIVTDYKRVVDGKREIPISSCPSYVEDIVYGTGNTLIPTNEDEHSAFQSILERLDEKAKKYRPNDGKKKPARKAVCTRYDKIKGIRALIGDAAYYYPSVNTLNEFTLNGKTYRIDDSVSEYAGKNMADGDILYDMDKIVCALTPDGKIHYFDMNMDMIPNEHIVCVQK